MLPRKAKPQAMKTAMLNRSKPLTSKAALIGKAMMKRKPVKIKAKSVMVVFVITMPPYASKSQLCPYERATRRHAL